ncbi:metallophosphoesterase [Xylophilus rhododendri]|uniref:Metallophosphoesterase n=1 Tax=Xylophilus rhododendri TaxID=2697032 RepID=A0A857J6Y9_9BURK|nr:metallophosphoesterase [Xylophilus rhododendri]QHI98772.1 metallophosphoesterase [Xylophilus rhododendri]
MKLQLLSDLHLEVQPDSVFEPLPDADLLVLAGDIGADKPGSLLPEPDFGLTRFSPLPQYGAWPKPVVFVPGNHEYDAQDFDAAHGRLRRLCDRLGIAWLERESMVIDGVRFLGSTLWTDFDALTPAKATPQQADAARSKAMRAADFYLSKTGSSRQGQPWLASSVRAQSLVCQQWLRSMLEREFDGPTVVVSHFAPSLRSADPRYGLVPGTAGFCNRLDGLLAHARLWLHGHLHAPSDYVENGCRVVANPLGYAHKDEQQGFRPRLLVDVPGAG